MSVWIPVVAALGASFLTSLGTWALDGQRQRGENQRKRLDARRRAYLQFLVAANGALLLGQSTRSLLMAESGVAASLGTLMRLREPADVHGLAFGMTAQLKPLLDAQSEVLACGTVAAAEAAGKVAVAAAEYLAGATEMSSTQRRLRGLVPWTPTMKQTGALQVKLDAVGEAVAAFISVVRRETGEEVLPVASQDPTLT